MEARELRIGNYVKVNCLSSNEEPGAIRKVAGVGLDIDFDNGTTRELIAVEGIELSEEWLVRFGFVKCESLEKYSDGFYEIIKDGGVYWVCMGPFKVQRKGANYVHEFQNLLHSLTGKELTKE